MKELEAKNLVDTTFTAAYSEDKFRLFIRNLFHDGEECTEKASNGKYIPEAFRDGIVSYKRLFKFLDPEDMEVDVLAVKLKNRRTLENARTMQRNFIARYLNGSRGGALKDAALVAFYTDDSDEWRFSLVRMDYVLDEEKNKVKKELTPARRFSFLVGGSEKTHTARRQLFPVLKGETKTTLTELEKAFNIESVTKEFFEKYKGLYLRLKHALEDHLKKDIATKADFEAKTVLTADFSKRLLGQIVFLYFLQKKGWLGVEKGGDWGSGPKDFLQALHRSEYGNYDNFFNDMLEPLFYEALATERTDNFYQRFNCRIPFLNGGLFEPLHGYDWVNTDILLDNRIFTEILEVFDLYNFTVREDEPLDREVAVDPEMLGKVFENLIPENERKGSGTFYTPREIVHYMCQESLINYLDAKLNIEQHQVEDKTSQPSLLPNMGEADLLTKYEDVYVEHVPRDDIAKFIYYGDVVQEHDATARIKNLDKDYKGKIKPKLPESVRHFSLEIDEALAHVKICDPAIGSGAFPVGVMNEIVRARQMLNAYLGNEGRSPYDFKRNAIQESIYGVDIEPSAVDIAKLRLWLSLVVDEDDFGNIKPLPNLEYKIVVGNSLIGFPFGTQGREKKLRKLTPLKEEYLSTYSAMRKDELKTLINGIIQSEYNNPSTELSLGYKVDFDFRWSFFEIFDDNAGFDIVIGNPPWGSKLNKVEKNKLKLLFPEIDSSTPNSFAYFIGLAKNISKNNIVYVLPDSILVKDFSKTRRFILPHLANIRWYQNIGVPEDIRPFINVEHDVCVIITKQRTSSTISCFRNNYIPSEMNFICQSWVAAKEDMVMKEYEYAYNLMLKKEDLAILNKIQKYTKLKDFLQCHEGIHTGNSREILFKDNNENIHCKPLYYGGGAGDKIFNYVAKRKGWFVDYRKEVIDKNKGYYASLRNENIFLQPKIYITRTGNPFKAFLDRDNYASNNFFSLQFKDYGKNDIELLKVILPFIVSTVAQYFIRTFAAPRLGSTFVETKIFHLLKFSVPDLNDNEKCKLLKMVNEVFEKKSKEPEEDTSYLEKQIDQLVYQLYDLTPEEIQIIEEATGG